MEVPKKLQRYNAVLMAIEGAMFVVSTSFLDAGTVVPVFTNIKSGGNTLAGIASAFVLLAPIIGRFLMGNIIGRIDNYSRAMTLWGIFSRVMILPALLATSLHAPDMLQAIIFVLGYGMFYFGDGFVALVWTDVLARTQPVRLRMTIHSAARVIGGIIGFFVATFVKNTLASSLPVDTQFTIIFAGACISLGINCICLASIKDAPGRVALEKEKTPWKQYIANFIPLYKESEEVRHTIGCKILYMLGMMTMPLNILFCTQVGHVTTEQAAGLVYMPMIGLVAGGFVWAFIAKKFGNRVLMLTSQLVNLTCAILSILSLFLAAKGISVLIPMSIVIMLLSSNVSNNQSYDHHIISVVPDKSLAHYIVLASIISAPFTLASVLAGFLSDVFGYTLVFILFAIITVISVSVTFYRFFSKNYVEPQLH